MVIKYQGKSPVVAESAFIAPNSTVIGNCTIGENSSVWFHAVIRADVNEIRVGQNTNIQDGSVLHCDHDYSVTISDNVTIGHNAIIHGCSIGSNCIVGANSLITSGKQIPEGSLVMGSPAKVIRQLAQEEIEGIKKSVAGYVTLSKQYARNCDNE